MSLSVVTLVPVLPAPLTQTAPRRSGQQARGIAPDTLLRSICGYRRAEQLMAGDLLLDVDGNIVELRGIRRKKVAARKLVRVAAFALGLGCVPGRLGQPVLLGCDQKVGLHDWRTEVLFGKPALVSAGQLVDGVSLVRADGTASWLVELQFDQPTLLRVGALTIAA